MTSLKAEFWREIWIYKRYPMEQITNLFLVVLIFMAIFWGGSLVGSGIVGSSLNSLVVGYTLWTLIQNTISEMAQTVVSQAESGIVEQQYLMPISSKRLFFNKSIVNIVFSLIQSILVLIAVMWLTNHWIKLPLIVVIPFILSLMTTIGLGYLMSSLVLRFKRVGSILIIFQYVYLAVLLTDFENYSIIIKILSCLLPISPMVSWIRLAINSHVYNLNFYLVGSIFNTILWLIIGVIIFNLADKYVKKNGTLAQY
ncbi:ABC transporter permease [Lactobacillus hamsteri]|nr:ABC transporter permease [Lactobacillus hamsteri]